MKTLLGLLFSSTLLAGPMNFSQDQKIGVQNTILAKVNGKTISMMDIKKKMDMVFHQHYPQLANSNPSRLQFYETSWRHVLLDMIDHELIIADAIDKEIKLTDGEIREVVEQRFGPNVIQTLDQIGLTHEEAWNMVKNELIVQRMSWWFIQAKAVSSVAPQDIRNAYQLHLDKNPPYSEWKYRVVSIRSAEPLPEKLYSFLSASGKAPEELQEELKQWEADGVSITVSNEYTGKTQELSDLHKAALDPLEPGTYSEPSFQSSRGVHRIFYLIGKTDVPAPAFEDLAPELRNDLIQKAIADQSQVYLNKLRNHYGFNAEQTIPEDLHPFSLQ